MSKVVEILNLEIDSPTYVPDSEMDAILDLYYLTSSIEESNSNATSNDHYNNDISINNDEIMDSVNDKFNNIINIINDPMDIDLDLHITGSIEDILSNSNDDNSNNNNISISISSDEIMSS